MQSAIFENTRQSVIRYFETNAPYWANVYEQGGIKERIYQTRLRLALRMAASLRLPAGSRILEVGCGTGVATVELARRGYDVTSIDSSEAMVRATRERARRARVDRRIKCVLGNAESLALPDRSFDLVLALGVLPWFADIRPPLAEMSRVLVPGAHLITTIDSRWGLRWFLEPLSNPLLYPAKEFALKALRGSVQDASARAYRNSRKECDAALSASDIRKRAGITFGFGPFTFFGRNILPESSGLRLHRWLQRIVDFGNPILGGCGAQYIVLGQKIEK
jgi:ubiquinone/menaquinone biosynthesis C-methylase UbiE